MTASERVLPPAVAIVSLVLGLVAMSAAANPSLFGLRVAMLFGHTALLAPLLLSAALLACPPREAFALKPVGGRGALLSGLCGGALWLASAGLLQLQHVLWPVSAEVMKFFEQLHGQLPLLPPWSGVLTLLAIAVWPAITEEMAFRGALLGSLRPRLSDTGAVLASAVLFALIHIPPGGYRVPFTLALGIALGALRVRTGSIVPAIVAHAVLNTTTVVLTAFLGDAADPTMSASIPLALALIAAGVVVAWPCAAAIGTKRTS